MTELTLEELTELDRLMRLGAWSALIDNRVALLAMARELVRLESALDHLERLDSGQGQHFWEPSEIYRSAKHWGWLDPTAPAPPVWGDE